MSMYDERIAKLKKQQKENQPAKGSMAGSMYDSRIAAIKTGQATGSPQNVKSFGDKYRADKAKQEERQRQFLADRQAYRERHGNNAELMKYDLSAGQKEIDELNAELSRLIQDANSVESGTNARPYAVQQADIPDSSEYTVGYGITNDRPYAAGMQVQREIEPTEDRIGELERLISKKQQDFNLAKHYQEKIAYEDTVKNADFDQFDDYAKSDDVLYNWINDAQFRNDYEARFQRNGTQSKYGFNHYDRMNASEIAIYNYYYAKSGKEAAQKYLDNIQETLNTREAKEMYGQVEGNTAAELVFGIAAGVNQFGTNVTNAFNTKDDYIPQSAYQIAGKMVDEGLADASIPLWYNIKEGKWEEKILGRSLGQIAYDAVTTGANMAPSILVSVATGVPLAGTAMMGLSAAGGAYQQALNEGFDKEQARGYSIMVGASEMVMEKLLGGISAVGGNALGKNAVKNIANAETAFKAISKKIGSSMLSEFGEEYLQEILDPVFRNIMLNTGDEVKMISAEAIYSGILGALTGAFMEAPFAIYGESKTASTGRKLKEAGSVNDLAKIGNTFAPETVAYKLAGKITSETGAYTIGQLFNEVNAKLTEQNVSEIAEVLTKEGIGEHEAKQYAEAFAYVVEGGTLPNALADAIEADTKLANAARQVLFEDNTTWNQRSQGYQDALRKLAMDKVTGNKTANVAADNNVGAKTRSTAEESTEVEGRDINTATQEAVTTDKIKSITKDGVVFEQEDGSEVSSKNVAYADAEDGLIYEAFTEMQELSTDAANEIIGIRHKAGGSSQLFANVMRIAYEYGYANLSEAGLLAKTYRGDIPNDVVQRIYQIGKEARAAEDSKRAQAKQSVTDGKTAVYRLTETGEVKQLGEGKEALKVLAVNERKNVGVQTAQFLQKIGVGGNYYFIQSYAENGKRLFVDRNGKVQEAHNGMYYSNGDIYIDLNAGTSSGITLFTISHELAHFVQQWNSEKYKVLADFLAKHYAENGISAYRAIKMKQQTLSESRGTAVSFQEAYHEFVADSLSTMFSDGNIYEKLLDLKKTDKSVFDKIRSYINKLAQKAKAYYSGEIAPTMEGQFMQMQSKETIDQLQQLFADALVGASENYRNAEAQKNTDQEVGVQYQTGSSGYNYSKPFAQQVDDWINGKFPALDTLLVGGTPNVLRNIGFPSLPITIAQVNLKANINGLYRGTPTEIMDHVISSADFKRLPDLIADPIAIIADRRLQNNKWVVSEHVVDVLVEMEINGKQTLVPIKIDGKGMQNGATIDALSISSVHGNKDAYNRLEYALSNDSDAQILAFYVNKNKATAVLQKAGYTITGWPNINNGFNHSISEPNSPVKLRITSQIETRQFKKWFRGSKIVNADGTPKVMYHGSPAQFTIFDKKKAKSSGLYGKGFYFTDSESQAGVYGNKYAVYLNIRNPLESGRATVERKQVRKFLETVADNEDYSIENYGTYDVDVILKQIMGSKGSIDAFRLLQDVNATAIGDLVEATELFNSVNGTEFDGIVVPTEVVAFRPEQIKSATDNIGTFDGDNPDIRYSDASSEPVSNRTLLANAMESLAKHEVEKKYLSEYKAKIETMNAEEQKLNQIKSQIKELSFATGPRDKEKLKALREEARKLTNRINIYDKQLLRLEASQALRNILEREKAKAYQRGRAKGEAALDRSRENRNKTAMRHKIQNVVKELNSLLLANDKKRHVPDNLKKPVEEALKLLNMDTVDAENRAAKYANLIAKEQAKENPDQYKIDAYTVTMENILRQGEKMADRIKELHAAYEEIRNSDDPDIANAYDPVISGAIKELAGTIGNTSLKNMTMEQLSDVYDMYRMVLIRVRDANKAMAENIRASIEELAKSTIREVQTAGGSKKYRISALDPVRKFDWDNLKPVYAMERIGSSTLTEVFNNVRAGEDTWAKDVSEARAYYLEKSKKYGYDKWDFDKKYRFESNSGIPFELTLEQIMSLYAYSKREQAADHLRLGGFVFDSNIETVKEGKSKLVKYKVNTADAHQITPEIMADIIGNLTKEQALFVDEMQEYLSTVMGAKGNEVTTKMYGVKLFKEKFYFPLKSAKQFMFEQNEVSGEVRIKNSGFTNKVVAKANNPVVLSNFMDVWSGHVNDMSMYHAFTLPLEDFNRVFNYNTPQKDGIDPVSVKGTIQNAYSPAAVQYVKNLITDLNGGARTDSTTGVINKLTGLFKKGAVFASLSVVVQQPSAIARAAALIDTKYFIGPRLDQKRHKYLWEEVKQYAPVALIKEMGYFDTNMGKSTQDYITGKEYEGFSAKMKALVTDSSYRDEILSKAPEFADEVAWCSIWEAVKRETKAKNPDMDTKSDAFLKLAGARFTEVITKTQVYDSVLARSANMRSKDTGMKMATAFMAEPTTSINMIEDAIMKGRRGDKRYARTAIGAVIASQIINSILVSFVYAGRDDDEDETYWEKYASSFTGSVIDGLNPATYIPFIKDIISIVKGYDVERSDMAVISDLWNAIQNLKNDKVSPYRKVEGFAGSIAQMFGLPVKNIMRDVRGFYNTIMTLIGAEKTTWAGMKYAVGGAITGNTKSNKEQLYEARLKGYKQHAARVAARYEDADSADAAVKSAIKDRFIEGEIDEATALKHMIQFAGMDADESHWTMDAWKYRLEKGSEDGYAKYDKLYDAVRSGENLQSVVKSYTDYGVKTSTLTGQITEEFKPLYLEASSSEKSSMKSKLVNAYVACGMEREKAAENLDDWDFESEYGFSYSKRKQAFLDGDVSREKLIRILMDHGYTNEDARAQIEVYEWEGRGIEDATVAAVREYNEYCALLNVPKDIYLHIRKFSNDTESDVDPETGKSIRHSAMKKVMEEIDAQRLTPEQKTAIARSLGWSEKNIQKYKLW